MTRVAFQGDLGAFSEEAAVRLCGNHSKRLPRRSFADVIAAVESGSADRGVLPVENSIAGAVSESVAAMMASSLVRAVTSIELPVCLHLLGVPGALLGGLRRVASHPVALAQCRKFLRGRPDLVAVEWFDTAGAARHVSELRDPRLAAVASQRAADRYRLVVLAHSIQDRPDNMTRFVLIERCS